MLVRQWFTFVAHGAVYIFNIYNAGGVLGCKRCSNVWIVLKLFKKNPTFNKVRDHFCVQYHMFKPDTLNTRWSWCNQTILVYKNRPELNTKLYSCCWHFWDHFLKHCGPFLRKANLTKVKLFSCNIFILPYCPLNLPYIVSSARPAGRCGCVQENVRVFV